MEINPFAYQKKNKQEKPPIDHEVISNISTKGISNKPKRYHDFIETKNEFYKQKFDILESQIEDFQRKSNRDKYLGKFKNSDDKKSEEEGQKNRHINEEPILTKEKIIINNPGNGCISGCNPFSIFKNFRCCGCFFIILIVLFIYSFLLTNNKQVQDFTIENIAPKVFGNIDTTQLPNPDYFAISDRLKTELESIVSSPDIIESITIHESELNTYILEQNLSFLEYPTEQYVTFDENRMNIYIKRKDKNDSWIHLKLQSDKLGKPQIISIQYGRFELSGEVARNFLNNLPLNIGNINFEKLDEKFSDLLFPSGTHKIDKVIFSKGKADISINRK